MGMQSTLQFSTSTPPANNNVPYHAVFLKHKPGRLTRAQLPTHITFTTITPASLPTLLQHVYRPALQGKENSALHALQTTLQADKDDGVDQEYRTAEAAAVDATLPPAVRQRASSLAQALAPLAAPWPHPATLEATSGHAHDIATALDNTWQLGQLSQPRMEALLHMVGLRVCAAAQHMVHDVTQDVTNDAASSQALDNAGQLVAAWQQHVHQLVGQWQLVGNPPWQGGADGAQDQRVHAVATRLGMLLAVQQTCRELQGLLSSEEAVVVGLDAAGRSVIKDLPLLEVGGRA